MALGGATLAAAAAWLYFEKVDPQRRTETPRPPAWSWEGVRSRTAPRVARVTSRYRITAPNPHAVWGGFAGGSGVLIAPMLVLTSSHLVRPWREAVAHSWDTTAPSQRLSATLESVAVQFPGQEAVPATLFAIAGGSDLALLQIPARPTAPLALGGSGRPLHVAEVLAVLSQDGQLGWEPQPLPVTAVTDEISTAVGPPLFLTARVVRVAPDERGRTQSGATRGTVALDRAAAVAGGGGAVVDRLGVLVGLTRPRFGEAGPTVAGGRSLQTRRYRPGIIEVVPLQQIADFLSRAGVAEPGAGTLVAP